MLAFITTLRHPQNSVDYRRVESLLNETLRSVSQQSSDDYVIIVVGNKRPDFPLPERTHFVRVDFPPPAPPTGAKTAREPFVWDKGTKLGVGLVEAQRFSPTHVMIFDADDFVHRDLASTVQANPNHQGWVVKHGWIYSRARNSYAPKDDFNRTCGTSFIIPFAAYGVSSDLTVSSTQSEVAEAFGERLSTIMGAHRNAEAWHREKGRLLDVFPYRAAVYHVDTGENHSGKSMSGLARPFDSLLHREFGMEPSKGKLVTLWSAFGPVALIEQSRLFGRKVSRRLKSIRGRAS